MVNLSEIFLGGMQQKYGLSELKSSLVCGFKNMGWSRMFFIDVGVRKLLLVNCSQTLNNWIKKSSLFCFCKFLFLLNLRICFCLKRAKPWLEARIKFNRYSMRSFRKALVRFNNPWIHLILRKFNWVSMSKIPSLPLQMGSWARCLGSRIFFRSRGNRILFFQFPFLYILEWYIYWPMYHSLDKRI